MSNQEDDSVFAESNENYNGETNPYDQLDLMYKTIQPSWGRESTQGLYEELSYTKKAWDLLAYYTKDLRLGNLKDDEIRYCNHWLEIAGDCLRQDFLKSFVTALSRVITVVELSQSRKGFLRENMKSSIREHRIKENNEPRTVFGTKQEK